jgi:hypothetical protein
MQAADKSGAFEAAKLDPDDEDEGEHSLQSKCLS